MSLPELTPGKIIKLQKNDTFCNNIIHHMHCNTNENYFTDAMGILHKKVIDFNSTFLSVIRPKIFIRYLLHTSWFPRPCWSHNVLSLPQKVLLLPRHPQDNMQIHKNLSKMSNYEFTKSKQHQFTSRYSSNPTNHISIDLIGPYKSTSQGNSYALTTICNLTGYLMTTTIPDQKTATVAIHLFLEIILKFGFPRILQSDNGTEFKCKLTEHLTQQLCIRKHIYAPTPPCQQKIRIIT